MQIRLMTNGMSVDPKSLGKLSDGSPPHLQEFRDTQSVDHRFRQPGAWEVGWLETNEDRSRYEEV